jgi:hypothetical protein
VIMRYILLLTLLFLTGCQSPEEQQKILENSHTKTEREKFNDRYDEAYQSGQNLTQPATY